LEGKSVKDILEIDKNLLLALTLSPPEYFVIDLELKKVYELGPGVGKLGLAMSLMPGYDPVTYPYVLCKEHDSFAILDPINNIYSQIYQRVHQFSGQTSSLGYHQKEESLTFDKTHQNSFVTDRDSFIIARYEIHPHILEALKPLE
jgi:hypothetical protein